MSLHQEEIGAIPEETARIAKAVFRQGNLCLRLRDVLGTIYDNQAFADLFPKMGRPAEARLSSGAGLYSAICGGSL